MDIGTVLIVLPIFFLLYQAMGVFFDSRSDKQWVSLGETPKEDLSRKTMDQFTDFSGKFSINTSILRYKPLHDRLELFLLRSGNPLGWKPENLLFVKEAVGLVIVLLIWRVGTDQPFTYVAGFLIGFMLPDFYMKSKVETRQNSIQQNLPGFVDIMALTLEGGLDFLAAVERILAKMKAAALKEELNQMLQECRLGTPRKEALKHLAFRVSLPDMQSLTSMIVQSEELGTGLAQVLRSYADDMRVKRILRAEELAGKAPVKLLFPMMVFFFPIVFVIIFGPIALNFMQAK